MQLFPYTGKKLGLMWLQSCFLVSHAIQQPKILLNSVLLLMLSHTIIVELFIQKQIPNLIIV